MIPRKIVVYFCELMFNPNSNRRNAVFYFLTAYQSLGDLKNKLTEKEIIELWENQDRMAEVFFLMWLETLEKSKKKELLV